MKDFTKQQKVIKVGNSLAVTLDRAFIDAHDVKPGDPIVASYAESHVAYAVPNPDPMILKDAGNTEYGKTLSKAEQRAVMHSRITPEFKDWVDKMLEEDKEALEALANL